MLPKYGDNIDKNGVRLARDFGVVLSIEMQLSWALLILTVNGH